MTWYLNTIQKVVLDVYNWLLPLVTINILWFLMCLTVVLIPPATAALFEIAYLAHRGQGPDIHTYLTAVRHWLVKSWIWGAVTLLMAITSIVAIAFYRVQDTAMGNVFLVISILFVVFVSCVQFYFWPYLFCQDHPRMTAAWRNAALTTLADPLFSLLNLGVTGVLLLISIALIAPIAVITPITIVFLWMYSLRAWLEHRDFLPIDNTADHESDPPTVE